MIPTRPLPPLVRWLLILACIGGGTWWSVSINAFHLDDMLRPHSDPYGYYQFLPASQGRLNWEHLPWTYPLEGDRGISVYSIGTAVMQAPFYFIAELINLLSGRPDEGYGRTHAILQIIAAVTYTVLGSMLVFGTLRRRFSRFASWCVALGSVLATNLFYYTFFEPGMSHAYAFVLTAWMVRLVVRTHERPTAGRLYALIVCCALIVLVRPLNLVLLLFPLLYAADGPRMVVHRLRRALHFKWAVIIGGATAALLWAPQLWYWHLITGHWIVSAYTIGHQYFNWAEPHPIAMLVSRKNGWFVYTPWLLPAVVALLVMAVRRVAPARSILAALVLTWWLYASWWCWWLGSGFGHRGFIEHLPMLAIAYAWGIDAFVLRFRRVAIGATVAVTLFLAYMNMGMSYLYTYPWDHDDWTLDKLSQVWEKALTADWRRNWHP